jgi:hypothetical protein
MNSIGFAGACLKAELIAVDQIVHHQDVRELRLDRAEVDLTFPAIVVKRVVDKLVRVIGAERALVRRCFFESSQRHRRAIGGEVGDES